MDLILVFASFLFSYSEGNCVLVPPVWFLLNYKFWLNTSCAHQTEQPLTTRSTGHLADQLLVLLFGFVFYFSGWYRKYPRCGIPSIRDTDLWLLFKWKAFFWNCLTVILEMFINVGKPWLNISFISVLKCVWKQKALLEEMGILISIWVYSTKKITEYEINCWCFLNGQEWKLYREIM